ncbi:TPA: hypothetical protein ACG3C3_000629 [Stenotrophomonas maltophilia]
MIVELYRGIAVPEAAAKSVIRKILQEGIDGSEGQWNFRVPDDVPKIQMRAPEELEDSLAFESVWQTSSVAGVCVSGTWDGAAYYACKHNQSAREGRKTPIVVTITTSIDQMYVDCRDFLMPAFQYFDRQSDSKIAIQLDVLESIFGVAVVKYFERCCNTNDQQERIRLGNMAAFDRDVVRHHLKNQVSLEGRYGATFSSAFFVSVPHIDVVDAEVPAPWLPPASLYSINDFFSGKPL